MVRCGEPVLVLQLDPAVLERVDVVLGRRRVARVVDAVLGRLRVVVAGRRRVRLVRDLRSSCGRGPRSADVLTCSPRPWRAVVEVRDLARGQLDAAEAVVETSRLPPSSLPPPPPDVISTTTTHDDRDAQDGAPDDLQTLGAAWTGPTPCARPPRAPCGGVPSLPDGSTWRGRLAARVPDAGPIRRASAASTRRGTRRSRRSAARARCAARGSSSASISRALGSSSTSMPAVGERVDGIAPVADDERRRLRSSRRTLRCGAVRAEEQALEHRAARLRVLAPVVQRDVGPAAARARGDQARDARRRRRMTGTPNVSRHHQRRERDRATPSSALSSTGISTTMPRTRSGAAPRRLSATFAPSDVPAITASSTLEVVEQGHDLLGELRHRVAPHVRAGGRTRRGRAGPS